tara:strand:- start:663 stop:1037 length:375 start_codon:yes stop_codon:yes gene_type:complete
MKEKLSLFIALSLLVCLTIYKKSSTNRQSLANNELINIETELNQNIDLDNSNNIVNSNNKNNNSCIENKTNTDDLSFNQAFKYYRECNYDTFKWNGLEYTTILDTKESQQNNKSLNNQLNLVTN